MHDSRASRLGHRHLRDRRVHRQGRASRRPRRACIRRAPTSRATHGTTRLADGRHVRRRSTRSTRSRRRRRPAALPAHDLVADPARPPGRRLRAVASRSRRSSTTTPPTTRRRTRAPDGIAYGDYGEPYRGQPSVVYRCRSRSAPTETIAVDARATPATAIPTARRHPARARRHDHDRHAGLGRVAPPARRRRQRRHVPRARRRRSPSTDSIAAGARPRRSRGVDRRAQSATMSFIAPGDDGDVGTRAAATRSATSPATEMTDANFASAHADRGDDHARRPRPAADRSRSTACCRETDYWSASARYDELARHDGSATTRGPLAVHRSRRRARTAGYGRRVLRRDRGLRLGDGERRRACSGTSATPCSAHERARRARGRDLLHVRPRGRRRDRRVRAAARRRRAPLLAPVDRAACASRGAEPIVDYGPATATVPVSARSRRIDRALPHVRSIGTSAVRTSSRSRRDRSRRCTGPLAVTVPLGAGVVASDSVQPLPIVRGDDR